MTTSLLAVLLYLSAFPLGALADSAPVGTPAPHGGALAAQHASPACTTTLTSLARGFRGSWTPRIEKTIYASTELVYSQVQCNGCALYIERGLADNFGGVGPAEMVTGTTTTSAPFRSTTVVCSPDPSALHQLRRTGSPSSGTGSGGGVTSSASDVSHTTERRDGSSSGPDCTFTTSISVSPVTAFDETKTVYTTSATTTSHIDCAGCNRISVSAVDSDARIGSDVQYTATATAESATRVTEYVCIKTPSIVSSSGASPAKTTTATATSSPQTPSSSAASANLERTVVTTLSETVYAATVTSVRSSSCGPVCAAGPPGVIPRRRDEGSDTHPALTPITQKEDPSEGVVLTRTVYSTLTILDPRTRTRTFIHCLTESTAGASSTKPDPRCRTSIAAGGEEGEEGRGSRSLDRSRTVHNTEGTAVPGVETKPPPHPPSPTSLTQSTSTVVFP